MAETLQQLIEAKVRSLPAIDRTAKRVAQEVLDALRSWEPSEAVRDAILHAAQAVKPSVEPITIDTALLLSFSLVLDAAIKEGKGNG